MEDQRNQQDFEEPKERMMWWNIEECKDMDMHDGRWITYADINLLELCRKHDWKSTRLSPDEWGRANRALPLWDLKQQRRGVVANSY